MASMITYSLTITCVKVSLLVLYRRIFDTKSFKRRSIVVGTACIAWFIVEIFTNIFQCRPFEAAFDATAIFTDKCIDLQAYYWGITASNMCLDLVVLCLPLHMVWSLHLPPKRKWGLAAMFSLGGL